MIKVYTQNTQEFQNHIELKESDISFKLKPETFFIHPHLPLYVFFLPLSCHFLFLLFFMDSATTYWFEGVGNSLGLDHWYRF
jgi:hypothetical protein